MAYYMESTKKNTDMVKKIIKILSDEEFTIKDAKSVLDFAKTRIDHASLVGEDTDPNGDYSEEEI